MRRLWVLPLLLALAGCKGASLGTQWKLRSFDVATADLAQLRIALRGPEWTMVTPERASLEMKTWTPEAGEEQAKTVTLRFQKGAHAGDAAELAQQGSSAPGLTVIELAPQSLASAQAAQREGARLKAAGGHQAGKLHLAGALACRKTDLPSGPIPIDVFVHVSDDLGWLPLYEQYDARSDEKDPEKLEEWLPPCGARKAM